MKYINQYANAAAYAADTNRPTNQSTVSNIADGTGVKFEGKNVLVEKSGAGIGDICVFDKTTSLKKFIKLDTYNAATLPASLVICGVVYYRTESKVWIVSKQNAANAIWAAPYRVKLSGFDLATGGSFTVTVNSTTTAAIPYTTSDTLATIATKIMDALTAVGFTSAVGWSVVPDVTYNCIIIQRSWSNPVISTFSVTDVSLKVTRSILTPVDYQCTLSGLVQAYSDITRKDKSVSYFAGCNYEKFLSYYSVNGSTDTNQAVGAGSIVKESVFTVADNPLLVAYYGTYAAYIQDKILVYPWSKNAILLDKGKSDTDALSVPNYVDHDGTSRPSYPAARTAKTYGLIVAGFTTGLEAGAWWLPSVLEMYLLIKNAKLDNTDAVNRSLTAIGGDKILASGYYPWTSSERYSYTSWVYSGSNGGMYNSSKNGSYNCRPVSAF